MTCAGGLKPINEVAHRRALEYYLRLKAKGPAHAKWRTVSSRRAPNSHQGCKAKTCTAPSMARKTARRDGVAVARRVHFNTITPGGLKADAPEKDNVHTMRRV
ncbi:hypothetical protein ERJ75_001246200 [Trypanosoma vivax]|nr:hypothetical protein ERJ75_001246200 [Trypanosoma vivax]